MHLRSFVAMGLAAALCSSPVFAQTPIDLSAQYPLGTAKDTALSGTGASAALTLAPQTALASWSSGPALPQPVSDHVLLSNGNTLYLLGGLSGETLLSSVLIATVNPDGTVTPFVPANATAQLPVMLGFEGGAIYNNVIYLVGGDDGTVGNLTNNVLMSVIGSDGQPGPWTTVTPPANMPPVRDFLTVVAEKGYLYGIAGGAAGTLVQGLDDVWYAQIQADGTLGPWTAANFLNAGAERYGAGGFSLGDTMWVAGGADTDLTTGDQIVLHDAQSTTLGDSGAVAAWGQAPGLPTNQGGILYNAAVVTGGSAYLIGGENSQQVQNNSALSAPFTSTGSLGAWAVDVSMPADANRSNLGAAATPQALVVTGGRQQGISLNITDTVYLGQLNPTGASSPFGTFDSPVIDFGKEETVGSLAWTANVPAGAGVEVQYRAAPATGAFGAWTDPVNQSPVTIAGSDQYLQYRVILSAGGSNPQSPSVSQLVIDPPLAPVYGDVNLDGKVNILDAVLALRIAVRLVTPTPQQLLNGDVAPKPGTDGRLIGDGVINVQDVVRILRVIVGLDKFP